MGKAFASAATLFAGITFSAIIKHHAMEKGLLEQCAKIRRKPSWSIAEGLTFCHRKIYDCVITTLSLWLREKRRFCGSVICVSFADAFLVAGIARHSVKIV